VAEDGELDHAAILRSRQNRRVASDANLAERVRALPGMERVLPALESLPPLYLVGGAVRDLLRGERGVDLDVCVESDARAAAEALAERLGGEARDHPRFATAVVVADGLTLDVAQTRRERYPRPGALPEVEPASLAEDLGRRDFTVNAMALGLSGGELGRLLDPHGGRGDLEDATIRVLHPGSLIDDPTRLLRAVRYEVRLGGRMDPATEELARAAAEEGALATVSGPRVRDQLLYVLAESEVALAVERLGELGLDRALHPRLRADGALVASTELAAGETGADRVLAALAALACGAPDELRPWIDGLSLGRAERERVLRAAVAGPLLREALAVELAPSALHALLDGEPAEALALALGLGAPAAPVLRFLAELRHVRLEVTGDDLRAAGAPEGPALGRALEATLRHKLDGRVHGREEELGLALELAGGEPR
jgi:tRNA nucleotidyltransferase (CCA-adding enzyme)